MKNNQRKTVENDRMRNICSATNTMESNMREPGLLEADSHSEQEVFNKKLSWDLKFR